MKQTDWPLGSEAGVVVCDAPAAGAVGGVNAVVAGLRTAVAGVFAVAKGDAAALAGRACAGAALAAFDGHVCLCVRVCVPAAETGKMRRNQI